MCRTFLQIMILMFSCQMGLCWRLERLDKHLAKPAKLLALMQMSENFEDLREGEHNLNV